MLKFVKVNSSSSILMLHTDFSLTTFHVMKKEIGIPVLEWDDIMYILGHISGSFLRRQLSIDNYHVKESQFLLFSRQKVCKNAKFVYITEIF